MPQPAPDNGFEDRMVTVESWAGVPHWPAIGALLRLQVGAGGGVDMGRPAASQFVCVSDTFDTYKRLVLG